MRKINTELIKKALIQLIKEAAFEISPGVLQKFRSLREDESSETGTAVLDILIENSEAAVSEKLPLCQDCGAAVVFIETGQQVFLEGDYLHDVVNRAVSEAYTQNYLRGSITPDPLRRGNTGDNTPAFIHTEIVPGESLRLTVLLKGGGSENMSALRLFRPTASVEHIISYVTEQVTAAGPNPCPPLFLGIGIGGTADIALLNSKLAPLREGSNPDPYYRDLEHKIMQALNTTGVGPLGLGGSSTCAAVYIKEAPAHIATLPVALNMNCHSFRYRSVNL